MKLVAIFFLAPRPTAIEIALIAKLDKTRDDLIATSLIFMIDRFRLQSMINPRPYPTATPSAIA